MPDSSYPLHSDITDPKADKNFRRIVQVLKEHDAAFAEVSKQVASAVSKADTAVQQITQITETTSGGVNNQTGTSYSLNTTDSGGIVTISSASAFALTLNTALDSGFFCSVENLGTATATLTPSTGTVNGAASISLIAGQGCVVFCDGTNWWAMTSLPTPDRTGVRFRIPAGSSSGTNVGPMMQAEHSGTLTKSKITVKSSDATIDLSFTIKKNGTAVFSATVAHATAPGSTQNSTLGSPITQVENDVYSIDVSSVTGSWDAYVQLVG